MSLECPCCGELAFEAGQMVNDGDPVPCGCDCWVSCDAESGPSVTMGDVPCEACSVRETWVDGPDSEAARACQPKRSATMCVPVIPGDAEAEARVDEMMRKKNVLRDLRPLGFDPSHASSARDALARKGRCIVSNLRYLKDEETAMKKEHKHIEDLKALIRLNGEDIELAVNAVDLWELLVDQAELRERCAGFNARAQRRMWRFVQTIAPCARLRGALEGLARHEEAVQVETGISREYVTWNEDGDLVLWTGGQSGAYTWVEDIKELEHIVCHGAMALLAAGWPDD